jgi:hypothetical protein
MHNQATAKTSSSAAAVAAAAAAVWHVDNAQLTASLIAAGRCLDTLCCCCCCFHPASLFLRESTEDLTVCARGPTTAAAATPAAAAPAPSAPAAAAADHAVFATHHNQNIIICFITASITTNTNLCIDRIVMQQRLCQTAAPSLAILFLNPCTM